MKGSTFKSKWTSFKISSLEKYQAVPKNAILNEENYSKFYWKKRLTVKIPWILFL